MTPEKIKKVREELELTQEQLAVILGVTKTSVARYEMKDGPRPQGDTERKLMQLYAFISSSDQKEKLKNIRNKNGGVASLAGILAIGAALFPVGAASIAVITLQTILGSSAIRAIYEIFKIDDNDNDS